LIWALVGALVGAVLAGAAGSLETPSALSRAWRVVSPALDASVADTGLGRGSHVAGGALQIARHAFFRSDSLVPSQAGRVASAEIRLAADSDALSVGMGGSGGASRKLTLHPDGYRVDGAAAWSSSAGRSYTLAFEGGALQLSDGNERVIVGSGAPGAFELAATDGLARIEAIRLTTSTGEVLIDEDFRSETAPLHRVLGALAGAVGGLGFAFVVAGASAAGVAVRGLLVFGPPVAVLLASPLSWILAVERLYLTETPPWELARWCLLVALVPLVLAVLASLPELSLERGPGRSWGRAGVVVALVATAIASRDLRGPSLLLAPLGFLWLVAPLWFLREAAPSSRQVLRDLPAMLAVAVGGWAWGLAPAVLWRLGVLGASAGFLLRTAPRAASDLLFLLLLSVPVAAEALTRAGYLATAWDITRLSKELPSAEGWQDPVPGWSASCGDGGLGVVFAGGSSTGGAYQFADEPDAFFAAQAHEALCARGIGVRSFNFGDGGRDSFTVARSIDTMFERADPDLVVLYLGVNDLLTRHHRQTRKQRAEEAEERSRATEGLAGVARRLRLTTAASLWLHGLPEAIEANVSDVPVSDAEENHRRVIAYARERGAAVLLLTEYVDGDHRRELALYGRMQQRLADELEGVAWMDVIATLEAEPGVDLLVDRNHLSREGNALLGAAIADAVPGLVTP